MFLTSDIRACRYLDDAQLLGIKGVSLEKLTGAIIPEVTQLSNTYCWPIVHFTFEPIDDATDRNPCT